MLYKLQHPLKSNYPDRSIDLKCVNCSGDSDGCNGFHCYCCSAWHNFMYEGILQLEVDSIMSGNHKKEWLCKRCVEFEAASNVILPPAATPPPIVLLPIDISNGSDNVSNVDSNSIDVPTVVTTSNDLASPPMGAKFIFSLPTVQNKFNFGREFNFGDSRHPVCKPGLVPEARDQRPASQ